MQVVAYIYYLRKFIIKIIVEQFLMIFQIYFFSLINISNQHVKIKFCIWQILKSRYAKMKLINVIETRRETLFQLFFQIYIKRNLK